MLEFPRTAVPDPMIATATNVGDTYVEKIADSTIESKTDANYRITRPRAIRTISTFSYSWTCLTEAEKNTLRDFWKKVRKSEMFKFIDYDSGTTYTVRFTGDFKVHYSHPEGYYLTLNFEEV
ncbi:hypothetical protein [Megasphaera vaginalis (ex Srinivasan et al. 2021)]|uniref:hypothetical protein n=1 Tax=Megasphaera vaginalis (ex Srinivasan et al. 2021) TaxID=1111454 RepID=UPI00056B3B84|nr:hypothetical protein [Megasphaera vaginalis (ex Srinivasan et al. 2021)]